MPHPNMRCASHVEPSLGSVPYVYSVASPLFSATKANSAMVIHLSDVTRRNGAVAVSQNIRAELL